ncbi:MAG: alpha/beta fold hydrolase [Gaiellaceae bacterium]
MKVVLLHAFPLDERMWSPQRPALEGHDVVAPNLYDLGGNSIDGWAERILADLADDFVAVGASMGGYVALAMARAAPERTRGLLLAGSRAGADSAERRAARDEGIRVLREEGIEAWESQSPAPPPPERTVDELVRATEALRDRRDASDVVRAFSGPLALVVGDRDDFLPLDEGRQIAGSAADGRLYVLEDTGHFSSIERPKRFNGILSELLQAVH